MKKVKENCDAGETALDILKFLGVLAAFFTVIACLFAAYSAGYRGGRHSGCRIYADAAYEQKIVYDANGKLHYLYCVDLIK